MVAVERTYPPETPVEKVHLLGVSSDSSLMEVMWPFVTLSCLVTLKSRLDDYQPTSLRSFRLGFTQSVYTRWKRLESRLVIMTRP